MHRIHIYHLCAERPFSQFGWLLGEGGLVPYGMYVDDLMHSINSFYKCDAKLFKNKPRIESPFSITITITPSTERVKYNFYNPLALQVKAFIIKSHILIHLS